MGAVASKGLDTTGVVLIFGRNVYSLRDDAPSMYKQLDHRTRPVSPYRQVWFAGGIPLASALLCGLEVGNA